MLKKGLVLLAVVAVSGCAANEGLVRAGGEAGMQSSPATIDLECPSATRIGCRYQGRVYPWDAWVAAVGYDTSRYAISEVSPSGGRALVKLVER